MTIPENSSATVSIPITPLQKITIEKKGSQIDPAKIEGLQSGKFELVEGEYVILVSK
jgi:hypothetical protein